MGGRPVVQSAGPRNAPQSRQFGKIGAGLLPQCHSRLSLLGGRGIPHPANRPTDRDSLVWLRSAKNCGGARTSILSRRLRRKRLNQRCLCGPPFRLVRITIVRPGGGNIGESAVGAASAPRRPGSRVILTGRNGRLILRHMGTAISPRGVMPKNRVPAPEQGRRMPSRVAFSVQTFVHPVARRRGPSPSDIHARDIRASVPRLIAGGWTLPQPDPSGWRGEVSGRSASFRKPAVAWGENQ
jgi:hypothetical protein